MSYEKLIKIKIHDTYVSYEQKSNNCTGDYYPGKCTIPQFLINAMGGVFQFHNEALNTLVFGCKAKLSAKGNFDDIWIDLSNDPESIDSMTEEIRRIFWEYCDYIARLITIKEQKETIKKWNQLSLHII